MIHVSMDWFKGNFTGKPIFNGKIYGIECLRLSDYLPKSTSNMVQVGAAVLSGSGDQGWDHAGDAAELG